MPEKSGLYILITQSLISGMDGLLYFLFYSNYKYSNSFSINLPDRYGVSEEEEKRKNAEILLSKTKEQLSRREEQYAM